MTPIERKRFERVLTREVWKIKGQQSGMAGLVDSAREAGVTERVVYRYGCVASFPDGPSGVAWADECVFLRDFRLDSTADINGGPLVCMALRESMRKRDAQMHPSASPNQFMRAELMACIGGVRGQTVTWHGFAGPGHISPEPFSVVAGEMLLSALDVDWRSEPDQ